jgi:hypothetical protein
MINIYEIHNINDPEVDILKKNFNLIKEPKIIKNYHPEYSKLPGNFFNILEKGRYEKNKGTYYVLTNDEDFVASGGWNEYELNPKISLIFTRFYVAPKYRQKFIFTKLMFEKIIEQTCNYEHIYITVNESNKKFYDLVSNLYNNDKKNYLPKIYSRFKPIGTKEIYYTNQYVLEYQK